ncbi:MAG: hypothetical protein ABSF48_17480 [Thermodesulfobacteriota bacterium]|jgi:hypothetical protein
MLLSRTSSHIHARRDIRSFHSGAASSGWTTVPLDTQRIHQERLALAYRAVRRFWLERRWWAHLLHYRQQRRLRK